MEVIYRNRIGRAPVTDPELWFVWVNPNLPGYHFERVAMFGFIRIHVYYRGHHERQFTFSG